MSCLRYSKVCTLGHRAALSLTRYLERRRPDQEANATSPQGRAHRGRGKMGKEKVLLMQNAHSTQSVPQEGKILLLSPSPPSEWPQLCAKPNRRRQFRAPACQWELQHRHLWRRGLQLPMLASGIKAIRTSTQDQTALSRPQRQWTGRSSHTAPAREPGHDGPTKHADVQGGDAAASAGVKQAKQNDSLDRPEGCQQSSSCSLQSVSAFGARASEGITVRHDQAQRGAADCPHN